MRQTNPPCAGFLLFSLMLKSRLNKKGVFMLYIDEQEKKDEPLPETQGGGEKPPKNEA